MKSLTHAAVKPSTARDRVRLQGLAARMQQLQRKEDRITGRAQRLALDIASCEREMERLFARAVKYGLRMTFTVVKQGRATSFRLGKGSAGVRVTPPRVTARNERRIAARYMASRRLRKFVRPELNRAAILEAARTGAIPPGVKVAQFMQFFLQLASANGPRSFNRDLFPM